LQASLSHRMSKMEAFFKLSDRLQYYKEANHSDGHVTINPIRQKWDINHSLIIKHLLSILDLRGGDRILDALVNFVVEVELITRKLTSKLNGVNPVLSSHVLGSFISCLKSNRADDGLNDSRLSIVNIIGQHDPILLSSLSSLGAESDAVANCSHDLLQALESCGRYGQTLQSLLENLGVEFSPLDVDFLAAVLIIGFCEPSGLVVQDPVHDLGSIGPLLGAVVFGNGFGIDLGLDTNRSKMRCPTAEVEHVLLDASQLVLVGPGEFGSTGPALGSCGLSPKREGNLVMNLLALAPNESRSEINMTVGKCLAASADDMQLFSKYYWLASNGVAAWDQNVLAVTPTYGVSAQQHKSMVDYTSQKHRYAGLLSWYRAMTCSRRDMAFSEREGQALPVTKDGARRYTNSHSAIPHTQLSYCRYRTAAASIADRCRLLTMVGYDVEKVRRRYFILSSLCLPLPGIVCTSPEFVVETTVVQQRLRIGSPQPITCSCQKKQNCQLTSRSQKRLRKDTRRRAIRIKVSQGIVIQSDVLQSFEPGCNSALGRKLQNGNMVSDTGRRR
ncbi:hypothetical protein KCU78_g85, partial [Aureobasidium melanogenum]